MLRSFLVFLALYGLLLNGVMPTVMASSSATGGGQVEICTLYGLLKVPNPSGFPLAPVQEDHTSQSTCCGACLLLGGLALLAAVFFSFYSPQRQRVSPRFSYRSFYHGRPELGPLVARAPPCFA